MLIKTTVSWIKQLVCRHDLEFIDNVPINHQTKSKWYCRKCESYHIKEKEHVAILIYNLPERGEMRYIFYDKQMAELMISCCGYSRGVAKFSLCMALREKGGIYRLRNHRGEICVIENMTHDRRFWKCPELVLPFNVMPFGPRRRK